VTDPRAVLAAANNADLYGAVFRARGIPFVRDKTMLQAQGNPPPYYSHAVILDPNHGSELLDRLHTLQADFPDGIGVKDSFRTLDLSQIGLEILFQAEWIWAETIAIPSAAEWQRITNPKDLLAWETAWNGTSPTATRIFSDSLLSNPDIAFWGRESGQGFDAGCIANLSEQVVGISNVFGVNAYYEAAYQVSRFGQGRAVVGYERDDTLVAALSAGFEAMCGLRVWTQS
jgi:hypothetical protein